MGIEENKAIARRVFDALSRGDTRTVLDLYADDVEVWTAGSLPFSGLHGRAEVEQLMPAILGAFPRGIRFDVQAMTAEGDRVAIEAASDGLHASGRRYRNQYHFLMIVRDGKVRMLKEYMDTQLAGEVLAGGGEDSAC